MIEDEYRDRRVLVTGAASGMGVAVTELLLAGGAEVHAADVVEVSAPVASALHCDLREERAVSALAADVPAPDAVFCCAGLSQTRPGSEVIAVNLLANRTLITELAPRMSAGGSFAVISSVTYGWERMMKTLAPLVLTESFGAGAAWWAEHGSELGDPYIASKMSLTAWCITAAGSLARRGIRLNVLGPGTTDTPMLPEFHEALGADVLDAMPCPIGRPSIPVEQARAMLFLNAPSSSYLVGAVLYNDGGMSADFGAMAVAAAAR